jgi:hypothetical protein
VIEHLRENGQLPHRRRPPPRHPKIKPSDHRPADSTPQNPTPNRQHPLQHERPPDGNPEVHGKGSNKKHTLTPFTRQKQPPSRQGSSKRILPAQ